jgi:hypothetical protein
MNEGYKGTHNGVKKGKGFGANLGKIDPKIALKLERRRKAHEAYNAKNNTQRTMPGSLKKGGGY